MIRSFLHKYYPAGSLFITGLIIIIGGFEHNDLKFPLLSLLLFIFLTAAYVPVTGKKIKFPPSFKYYSVFLFIFLLSILWSKNAPATFAYLLLFFSGGIIWLQIYNSEMKHLRSLPVYIILTGLFFGILFIYNSLTGRISVSSYNLINYSVASYDHHHIGDLWAVVMGILVYLLTKGSKGARPVNWLLTLLGLYFLYVSHSRSAYVSLAAGLLFFDTSINKKAFSKMYIYPLLILVFGLFIWSTTEKSLIFHRIFYLEGIIGIIKYPFGLGVGNFSLITSDQSNSVFGITSYSAVADNIFLEMIAGLGVFAISFFIWIIALVKKLPNIKEQNFILSYTILIIISVNFLFNYIYFIPTILWIWFLTVGVLQKTKINEE